MCNIGNLLLAVGLFLEQKMLIRVAVIWLVPGVAVWVLYVVPTWRVLPRFGGAEVFAILSSSLAHLGGISVGLVVLRRIGMDARAWLFAFGWYFVVQLLSRLLTPGALNVNVSHDIPSGWEQTFSSYFKFWLVLTTLVGLSLWMLGRLLRLMWPSALPETDARAQRSC